MDFSDQADGQDFARGLASELVRTVAGTDRDGQCIDLRTLYKFNRFVWVGQQLRRIKFAFKPVTILCFAHSGFQGSQATEFAFDRCANRVRDFDDFSRDGDVVLKASGCFCIRHQRAVHHDRREIIFEGRVAGCRLVPVILVHHNGNMGVGLDRCQDQVAQEVFARVGPRTARRLQDHRAVGFIGSLHDRLDLLHVVDVKCWDTVAILGCVIEQESHRDECHGIPPKGFGQRISTLILNLTLKQERTHNSSRYQSHSLLPIHPLQTSP